MKPSHLDGMFEKGRFNSPHPPGRDRGYLEWTEYQVSTSNNFAMAVIKEHI